MLTCILFIFIPLLYALNNLNCWSNKLNRHRPYKQTEDANVLQNFSHVRVRCDFTGSRKTSITIVQMWRLVCLREKVQKRLLCPFPTEKHGQHSGLETLLNVKKVWRLVVWKTALCVLHQVLKNVLEVHAKHFPSFKMITRRPIRSQWDHSWWTSPATWAQQ